MADHLVEIHVLRVEGAVPGNNQFNNVGVVVPAKLEGLQNGQTVEFHYNVDQSEGAVKAVDIRFSRQWSLSGERTMELTLNTPKSGEVTGVVTGQEQRMKYTVFCHSIEEYAIGDSPPEMNLGP